MIFLNDSINLDSISQQLIKRLPQNLTTASDGIWTKDIADGLYGIGNEAEGKFHICCHGSKEQGEWLLDLIWMVSKDWRTVLAVESEWGSKIGAIQEDFGKLMSIKARHKLLFFKARDQAHADEIMKDAVVSLMEAYPYHLAGEEYMTIGRTSQGAFRYRFDVRGDGRLNSVQFNQMGAPLPWPWAT